jgi:hypothetical protein
MIKISGLCLLATLIITASTLSLQVHPATSKLVDESGRTRVFHGVNVVYK